jgi:hypothetical protein
MNLFLANGHSCKFLCDYILVTGATTIGLKELVLPDPSIVITKVNDSFDLTFSVHL